jgi:glycosyltransferase involved in cell wall biosynthesis
VKIAIVIPAFDEARTIRDIALRARAESDVVIVVDDGSGDGTDAALDGLPVTVLRNARNLGKGAALWRGFAEAFTYRVDAIVTLDGDGQHRPEDIGSMIDAAVAHPGSIVIGARLRRKDRAPRMRRFANRFGDFWLSWACGEPICDSQSGLRLYPAEVLHTLDVRHDEEAGFAFESEVLIEAATRGCGFVAVPIEAVYRADARLSHFRPIRDFSRIGFMVTRRLLAQRMNVRGLWASLSRAATIHEPDALADSQASPVPGRPRRTMRGIA